MMEALEPIAQMLRKGGTPAPITVRQLLSWAGAQRRGYWIVRYIRTKLAENELETAPDFESAYIDSLINFALSKDEEPSDSDQPDSEAELVGQAIEAGVGSSATPIDATQRISKLKAANCELVSVRPDTLVEEAVGKMLMHDFSQLPVMTNSRDVKGVVTWASIGSRLALQKNGRVARDFMDHPHPEIRSDASLWRCLKISRVRWLMHSLKSSALLQR
jgi:CBS domain-containing protein